MTSSQKQILNIISDLKGHLNYLKLIGYKEIPVTLPDFKKTQNKIVQQPLPPKEIQADQPLILEGIQNELANCKRCKLSLKRTNIVFGSGNKKAQIVFVGEGPGEEEDKQGLPFVGRAGQKLTDIIEKGMGLKRSDVYICNIVKCRPPKNRDPYPDEIKICLPFLEKQIKVINPKVIVALGKPASSTLLGRNVAITKERGTWHSFQGYKLMLTFHPAYLLRNYTIENRRLVQSDVHKVISIL